MHALARTCGAIVVALAWAGQPAKAQDPTAGNAQGQLSVTIYNGDIALVQDVRQLPIAQGRSQTAFPDVSARIQPETLSFAADGAAIVEQNFDFDLLTPDKLMEKFPKIKGITLNSSSIDNLLIPIPPFNEQFRIIATVDQLSDKLAQLSQ